MGVFARMVLIVGAWEWHYAQSDELGSLKNRPYAHPEGTISHHITSLELLLKEFASRFSELCSVG